MRRSTGQHGQVIVLFAIALVALVAAVGLVVDVGYVWAQGRNMQNSADAAAKSGALALAKRAAGDTTVTDQFVYNAVFTSAQDNESDIEAAFYTDWQGNLLPGSPQVGAGTIPLDASGFPPSGVQVTTRRDQEPFFSRIVGINNFPVLKDATAVSGPTNGCIDTVDGCALLPITIPVKVLTCGQGNTSVYADPPQEWAFGQRIILPLCGGNPGSVGWLDWTPPAGGADEVKDVILDPPDIEITLPSWKYITETGDISSLPVEDALNTYIGKQVLLPFFDDTCGDTPPNLLEAPCNDTGASGQNQWYWITKILRLKLEGAYVNGNNSDVCGTSDDGVPVKECLIGSFVTFIETGSVGAPCPPEGCPEGTAFSVQLIK